MPAAVTTVAMLLAFVALPERIDVAQLAGTGVVILGLVLIGSDGLVLGAASSLVGDLMFVGAGLLLAAYTVLIRRWHLAGQLSMARSEVGLIFQRFNLIRRLSALDNVLASRLGDVPTWRVMLRRFPLRDRQLALAALDRVGMLSYALQRADNLSGGQQRVAIARALAQQSRFVLADEPVASLDPESAKSVLSILRDIVRERMIAVLVSLHQVEFAIQFADRVIGPRAGRMIADRPAASFGEIDHRMIFAT
jgi:ABC-type phosphate/phosphonate transport system ATPase subunit